jgi:hypothetical protein
MVSSVASPVGQRRRVAWTGMDRVRLRGLWPLVVRGQLSAADVAAEFPGRTAAECCSAARAWGLSRRRPRLDGPTARRLRLLRRAGRLWSEIAPALGCHPETVKNWARRLGIVSPYREGGPVARAARLRVFGRRLRAAGRASLTDICYEHALARWSACGYPPGVATALEAECVDRCRSHGGVTIFDLARRNKRSVWGALQKLAGRGVLMSAGRVASRVETGRGVTVYRPRVAAPPAAAPAWHTPRVVRVGRVVA